MNRLVALCVACSIFIIPCKAQDCFQEYLVKKLDSIAAASKSATTLYPSDALQALMIPSGWGSSGTYLFAALGGIFPKIYTNNRPDLDWFAGVGSGDAHKAVSFAVSMSVSDFRAVDNLSANVSVSRAIGRSSGVTIGANQLFSNYRKTDSPGSTWFIAFSHSIQCLPSKTPGLSKLSFTVGAGNGRYYLKSKGDKLSGKGIYGTGVFGGISYELLRNLNLNAEWDGLNAGVSFGYRHPKVPVSIGLGLDNLTRYTGNKPFIVGCIGYALPLKKNSK